MSRKNLYTEASIGKLQQGYIFNNAISENYKSAEVFGLIITPRCDIENAKVLTFHYLPVVKLEDWLLNDYWYLFRATLIKNIEQSINQIFGQNNISKNLLGAFSLKEIRDKFGSKINKKQVDSFTEAIDWLEKINSSDLSISKEFLSEIHEVKKFNKLGSGIMKELTQNNRREFYLIEDWNDDKKYLVVLLREVQKISWELGLKIADGISYQDLMKGNYDGDDILISSDCFIFPFIGIKSPFIEHIIQKFFMNFGRIGISDHERELELKLIVENILL